MTNDIYSGNRHIYVCIEHIWTHLIGIHARLAIDRSICILTRPAVIAGFNRSLLGDWWSIGRLK